MKTLIPALCILLLVSCRTKKEVLKTEVKQSDTLIVKSEVIKAPVLNQSLTIHEICDSITGEVVRFEKIFVVDGDSINILTDANNSLHIRINQRERDLSTKDSIIRVLRSQLKSVSETVIYKKDWKWIIGAAAIFFAIGFFRPWRFLKPLSARLWP